MDRRLRIIVPAVQLLASVTVLLLKKLAERSDQINFNYYLPARQLVEGLNYPLKKFWLFVTYLVAQVPFPNPTGGAAVIAFVLIVSVFLASIVLFWFLVVREIELRLQGRSLLRFSNPLYAISAIVALLGATLGTLVSVYSDIRIKIPFTFRSISTIGLFLEILPQLIILLWALAFAWMALSDIRRFRQVVVYPKSSVNSQTKDI